MKILGLDQASAITGFSVLDVNGNVCEYGKIDLHQSDDTEQRLRDMSFEIDNLLDRVKPSVLVIEDVSLQTNVVTLVMLARLQGYIIHAAWERNIPITIYKPSAWRKLVGIKSVVDKVRLKRPELKKQAVALACSLCGEERISEDVSEAIMISRAYYLDEKGKNENGEENKKGRKCKKRVSGTNKQDSAGKSGL